MKTKHLMLTVAYAATLTFASCSLDPYELPAKEEYTRNFIKTFGLIDPDQNFNLAKASTVTVNLPSMPCAVKVYALVDSKYYLVADIKNARGTVNIPIDIPDGTNNLLVKVNGTNYNTSPGGVIDASSAKSRDIASDVVNGEYSSKDFKISVTRGDYKMYNTQQLAPINYTEGPWADYYSLNSGEWQRNTLGTSGFMPEIDNDRTKEKYKANTGNYYAHDPYHDADINKDFTIRPGDNGSFTIQPMFWHTSATHTLGVYPIDETGRPISKSTGEPIDFPAFDTFLTEWDIADLEKAGVKSWDDLKTTPLGDMAESVIAKFHNKAIDIINNMVMLPFYTDRDPEDIQIGKSFGVPGKINSISLENSNIQLIVGKSEDVYFKFDPYDYTGVPQITVADESIATASVSLNQYNNNFYIKVIGLNEGSTTITASSQDKSCTATVTVSKGGISFANTNTELLPGETLDLYLNKTGVYTNMEASFESSDKDVATVSGNTVTAVAAGYATIKATCGDAVATLGVSVVEESESFFVTFNYGNIDINTDIGQKYMTSQWGGWDYDQSITIDEFKDDMMEYFSDDNHLAVFESSNKFQTYPSGSKPGLICNYKAEGIYSDNFTSLESLPGQYGYVGLKLVKKPSAEARRHYSVPCPTPAKSKARDTDRDMPAELNTDNVLWSDRGGNEVIFSQDELNSPNLARSRTYTVTVLDKDGKPYTGGLGMYIYRADQDRYFCSQTLLNYGLDGYPCPATVPPCFAASFKHPMSERLYFSFEDWCLAGSDTDLQDLIFTIDDVDEIRGTNTITSTSTTTSSETVLPWIVAVEDLGATDDFDFNDVIFQLQSLTTDSSTTTTEDDGNGNSDSSTSSSITKQVTIQAMAAGGTMETYLHYDADADNKYLLGSGNQILKWNGSSWARLDGDTKSSTDTGLYEWHSWFGGRYSDMINTLRSDNPNPGSCDITAIVPKSNSGGFTLQTYSQLYGQSSHQSRNVRGFYITINNTAPISTMTDIYDDEDLKGNSTGFRAITAGEPGDAPQMFLIPDIGHKPGEGWYWPEERHHILEAYPTFVDWVNGTASDTPWHKATSGVKVIRAVAGKKAGSTSSSSTTR